MPANNQYNKNRPMLILDTSSILIKHPLKLPHQPPDIPITFTANQVPFYKLVLVDVLLTPGLDSQGELFDTPIE